MFANFFVGNIFFVKFVRVKIIYSTMDFDQIQKARVKKLKKALKGVPMKDKEVARRAGTAQRNEESLSTSPE
jgi:hypothetical protein